MEQLLKALQAGNEKMINVLACELLITKSGQINLVEKSAFEKFAPCRIYPGEQDSCGWLTGVINYNGTEYVFG